MIKPKVSVVIAAYNAAETLLETLASVDVQTYRDFELIVIDDGSSDATPTILESYANKWPWMRWVRQNNSGVSTAREHGIALAEGEYIAFLDADDLWVPHKLSVQMALFERNASLAVVYSDERDFFPHHDADRSRFQIKIPAKGQILSELFCRGNFISTSSVVVKKAALLQVGGFNKDLKVNEDFDLWLRLAEIFSFDFVKEVLVRKRILATGLTCSNEMKCCEQDLKIIDFWLAKRPDLFTENSLYVRRRRAVIFSRIAYQHLVKRDFHRSRNAYIMAIKLGQRNRFTLQHFLASLLPPVARLFWLLKSMRQRIGR